MLPSIKTLRTIAYERAGELRRVLESDIDALETMSDRYPRAFAWFHACYHRPPTYLLKLYIADEILGTYGVEGIPAGHGRKSPGFDYCNAGDSYRGTLAYIHGRGFRVTSWGDIVERGNYD